jgi:hypothetical protein
MLMLCLYVCMCVTMCMFIIWSKVLFILNKKLVYFNVIIIFIFLHVCSFFGLFYLSLFVSESLLVFCFCLSVYYPFFICVQIFSICFSASLFIGFYICIFDFWLNICLSVRLFICLSVCPFVRLSVHVCS